VLEMRGDQLVAGGSVGSVKHLLELFERHLEVPEPAYGLTKRYLGGFVVTSADHPTIRMIVLADPDGNPFNLATLPSE